MKPQPPSEKTLKRYGLSREDWLAILDRQLGVCIICGQEPKTGRLVIDHSHVKGWKKLPPEKRKLHVRGLTCWWDNKTLLGRGLTLARAEAVVEYLTAHNNRLLKAAFP